MYAAVQSPDVLCSHAQGVRWMQGPHVPTCPSAADTLKLLGSPALILWQAGGNFGDLWTFVQHYRMPMILEFDRLIKRS